jgi:protein O-mannosyl-transferase
MSRYGKFFPYLVICFITLAVYLPSFSGEFIMDDLPLIKDNAYIRDWHSLGSFLVQEDGCTTDSSPGHTGYYRPLLNLSYVMDYKIWGNNGPGFRITNLILHCIVCLLLYSLYKLILNKKDIALWLAIIFALHPLATESVSWVASRNNILATLFGILSLLFYIKAYKKEKFIYYSASILCFMLSVFCKEFGIMLLPILFLYQRTLNSQKKNIIIELREYIPFIIISILYFFFRNSVIGSIVPSLNVRDIFVRLYCVPFTLFLDVRVIFLPFNLHSFIIERPDSFLSTGIICGIIFWAFVVNLLVKYRQNSLILFSVPAFLLAIFPASGIIPIPAPSLIAMRWLYYPTVFILLVLAQPFERLSKSKGVIVFSVMICVALFLGINTYMLNRYLWHSEETFFRQEVFNFDNRYYAGGLARIFVKEEKYQLAEKYFIDHIKYEMNKPEDYIDYASLLVKKGDAVNSLLNLDIAETFPLTKSQLSPLLIDRGIAYLQQNNPERALKELKKSIQFTQEDALAWENIGIAFGRMGDNISAIDALKKAIRYGSTSTSSFNNLALAYILNNECQKAIALLDRKGYRDVANAKDLLERAKKCSDKVS